jgi:predicted nucleic acid-binding protein
MGFLIDTNVLSELRKGARCDANVRAWLNSVAEDELHLSVITIAEVRHGIEKVRHKGDAAQARHLEEWLAGVYSRFADRIVPVDREVAEVWGYLMAPDPLPASDAFLAATALVYGLTFVTRNTRDVERARIPLLNPFADHLSLSR